MIHQLLDGKKLVLASASPRRKEIFRMLGLNFLVKAAAVDEPIDGRPPRLLVQAHASAKALAVAKLFDEQSVVVGADTVVWLDKTILGKPESAAQAGEYLGLLSGRCHTVYTGVSVIFRNRQVTAWEKSLVTFKTLSEMEIEEYVRSGEPMDKAGAYGIQGLGSQFIMRVQGCYFNVMGFPVFRFYTLLQELLGARE